MPSIFQINAQNTIFAAPSYPRSTAAAEAMGLDGARNEEMRALTIAAFRPAQNNAQLSTRSMNGELLLHLLAGSESALGYWVDQGRLSQLAFDYALTPAGLAECQNALLGLAGSYSTTEEKVQEWVARMVSGDDVATQQRTFPSTAWLPQ